MLDVNGAVYQIPGSLEIFCISYNKTLFEENGWTVPSSLSELLATVKQIRTDNPEITPISSSLMGGYPFIFAGVTSKDGFLSTTEGYQWEQNFWNGEGSFGEGFSEGLDVLAQLIDAGAFDGCEKYETVWTCEDEFIKRESAMNIQWAGAKALFSAAEKSGSTDEFGLLSFFGLNDNSFVVGHSATSFWSVNRKLGEKGNEEKLQNALEVME